MDHKEVRRQVSDTVDYETDDEIKKAWHRFGIILVIVSGLMITAVVTFLLLRGIGGAGKSDQPSAPAPLTFAQVRERAQQTAKSYLEADTIASKTRYVFDGHNTRLRMTPHYNRRPIERHRFQEFTAFVPESAGDRQLYVGTVRYHDGTIAPWTFEFEDREAKIHWEALVAYAEADWDAFVTNRVTEPTQFRVEMAVLDDDPQSEHFPAEEYLGFRMGVPYSGKSIVGFLSKSSDAYLAKEGRWEIPEGVRKNVIASLRYSLGSTDGQAIIDTIEEFSWIEGVDRW